MSQKHDCSVCKVLHKPDCNDCKDLDIGCKACIKKYSPNCKKCFEEFNIPNLHKENILIYKIWVRVQEQHIMGFNGPVSLNLVPVFRILDLFKIDEDEKLKCLDMLQTLYYKVRLPLHQEATEKQKEKKHG